MEFSPALSRTGSIVSHTTQGTVNPGRAQAADLASLASAHEFAPEEQLVQIKERFLSFLEPQSPSYLNSRTNGSFVEDRLLLIKISSIGNREALKMSLEILLKTSIEPSLKHLSNKLVDGEFALRPTILSGQWRKFPYDCQVLFLKLYGVVLETLIAYRSQKMLEEELKEAPLLGSVFTALKTLELSDPHLQKAQEFVLEGLKRLGPTLDKERRQMWYEEVGQMFRMTKTAFKDAAHLHALQTLIRQISTKPKGNQNYPFFYWTAELLAYLAKGYSHSPTYQEILCKEEERLPGLFNLYEIVGWEEKAWVVRYQLNELCQFFCDSANLFIRDKASKMLQENKEKETHPEVQAQLMSLLGRRQAVIRQKEVVQQFIQADAHFRDCLAKLKEQREKCLNQENQQTQLKKELQQAQLETLGLQEKLQELIGKGEGPSTLQSVEEIQVALEKEQEALNDSLRELAKLEEDFRKAHEAFIAQARYFRDEIQFEEKYLKQEREQYTKDKEEYKKELTPLKSDKRLIEEQLNTPPRPGGESLTSVYERYQKLLDKLSRLENVDCSLKEKEEKLLAREEALTQEKEIYEEKWRQFEENAKALVQANAQELERKRELTQKQRAYQEQEKLVEKLQKTGPVSEADSLQTSSNAKEIGEKKLEHMQALERLAEIEKELENRLKNPGGVAVGLERGVQTKEQENSLSATLYRSQGNCYYGMSHFYSGARRKELLGKAIVYLRKSLEYGRGHLATCKDLANACLDFGHPSFAQESWQAFMQTADLPRFSYYLVRAKVHLSRGRTQEALDDVQSYFTEGGFAGAGYVLKGMIYENQGKRFLAACEYLRAFLENKDVFAEEKRDAALEDPSYTLKAATNLTYDRDEARLLYRKGLEKMQKGASQKEETLAAFLQSIARDPSYDEPHYPLIEIYREGKNSAALSELGQFYLERKEYEKAKRCVMTALDYTPSTELKEQILYLVGMIAHKQGAVEEAQENFQALAGSELRSAAFLMLGRMYASLGNWQEAEANFKIAWGASPDSLEAAQELAWCYLKRKKYQEFFTEMPLCPPSVKKDRIYPLFEVVSSGFTSWDSLLKTLEIFGELKRHVEGYKTLLSYDMQGDIVDVKARSEEWLFLLEKWIESFFPLIERSQEIPMLPLEKHRLVKIYLQANKLVEAENLLVLVEKEDPQNPYVYFTRAALYTAKKQHDKSRETMQLLLQKPFLIEPKDKALAYRLLGEAHFAQNKKDEALKAYREALKYNREDKDLLYHSACALHESSPKEALDALKIALSFEKRIRTLELLVAILLTQKSLDEAEFYCQQGLEIAPGNPVFLKINQGSIFQRAMGRFSPGISKELVPFPESVLEELQEDTRFLENLAREDQLLSPPLQALQIGFLGSG